MLKTVELISNQLQDEIKLFLFGGFSPLGDAPTPGGDPIITFSPLPLQRHCPHRPGVQGWTQCPIGALSHCSVSQITPNIHP